MFVIGDFLSLNLQSGASSLSSKPKLAGLSNWLVVAGLVVQILLLGFFGMTAVVFQIRLGREPTTESRRMDVPWRRTLYMIYVVSTLIFARSIFRVVEYRQGQNGYSLGHEWTLYAFDSLPMFFVAVVFWFWWPGDVLRPADEHEETVELADSRGKLGRL